MAPQKTNPMNDEVSDELLRTQGVCKSFRSSQARISILKNLDLTLRQSETLAVVGASGIGKSTLLHILGTLDHPDQGSLYFKGQDVFKYSEEDLAHFRNKVMGFVFQFHHLLPEFSALENTQMPALIQGMEKSKAAQLATKILTRVGLEHRLHHKAVDLSGGEQQRVALARALVLTPPILFADEPTGNLDKSNSQHVHQLLLELNRELGMAMVVVTHNMELAAMMARQATLVDGKLEYLPKFNTK